MINQQKKELKSRKEYLETLLKYQANDQVVHVDNIKKMLAEKQEREYLTGYHVIDNTLRGIDAGSLVVVSGATGEGKTTFSTSLTKKMSNKILWFTYEMSYREFIKKFDVVPENLYLPQKLTTGHLDWIEQRIIEGIAKFDTEVVFIDHLHYLVDMEVLNNPSLKIGAIVRRLKRIAVNWGVVIVLIAHTTKVKADENLDLDMIRDSSFIAQEADVVFMIRRDKDTENEAIVGIRKNRKSGKLGNITMVLIGKTFQVKDYSNEK